MSKVVCETARDGCTEYHVMTSWESHDGGEAAREDWTNVVDCMSWNGWDRWPKHGRDVERVTALLRHGLT